MIESLALRARDVNIDKHCYVSKIESVSFQGSNTYQWKCNFHTRSYLTCSPVIVQFPSMERSALLCCLTRIYYQLIVYCLYSSSSLHFQVDHLLDWQLLMKQPFGWYFSVNRKAMVYMVAPANSSKECLLAQLKLMISGVANFPSKIISWTSVKK